MKLIGIFKERYLKFFPFQLLIIITGFLSWQPLKAQPADSILTLSRVIQEAIVNNPELRSVENTWRASEARIPQAGALPDPVLSFNLMNLPVNTFDFDQEPMTGKQISLMQKFPFPGKQGLREDIARENSTVMNYRFQEFRNQLVQQVKNTYYQLYLIDKSIETTLRNTEVLEEFVKIAETKYSVGRGLQQDVLRAQVELSKMTDRLINLEQRRETLEANFNALLNRAPDTPVGRVKDLEFEALRFSQSQLKDSADVHRPLLQAWQANIRQSEKQVGLAKKNYLPDFSLGVAYSQRDVLSSGMGGVDFFSGMLNLEVPLYFWRKQKKQVEEFRYNLNSTQYQYQQVRNRVFADLESFYTDLEKNQRLIDLYTTGIIPQAQQSLQSAIAGYQTDKVDFLTLLNNQINLFNFELDYYRILSDYFKNTADLEATTGINLITTD